MSSGGSSFIVGTLTSVTWIRRFVCLLAQVGRDRAGVIVHIGVLPVGLFVYAVVLVRIVHTVVVRLSFFDVRAYRSAHLVFPAVCAACIALGLDLVSEETVRELIRLVAIDGVGRVVSGGCIQGVPFRIPPVSMISIRMSYASAIAYAPRDVGPLSLLRRKR